MSRGTSAVLLAAVVATGPLGCGAASDVTDDVPPALAAAMSARTVYPAKREEWRTDITRHTDSTMVPRVFRASGSTVALLQASPTRISQFELHGRGLLLSTRPGRVDSTLNAEVPRDLVAPVELSRVTDEGEVDVIDSASSVLMRESIGGFVFRRDLPLLRGGSHRLCTVAPATLMHVRRLGERRALEAYTITANANEDRLVGRHRLEGETQARLRFGSGDVRRCLLLGARTVYIVTAVEHDGIPLNPRITQLTMPGDVTRRGIGDNAAAPAVAVEQPYVVDAAVVDGGYVVLVGVTSDGQGRLLDYYDERGAYLQSAMLPFTASAMTGAGPRFLVLHQDVRYRWWLSSWLTPMAARGATPPPQPRQLDQAPERRLFELPPKSDGASATRAQSN